MTKLTDDCLNSKRGRPRDSSTARLVRAEDHVMNTELLDDLRERLGDSRASRLLLADLEKRLSR